MFIEFFPRFSIYWVGSDFSFSLYWVSLLLLTNYWVNRECFPFEIKYSFLQFQIIEWIDDFFQFHIIELKEKFRTQKLKSNFSSFPSPSKASSEMKAIRFSLRSRERRFGIKVNVGVVREPIAFAERSKFFNSSKPRKCTEFKIQWLQ